MTSFDFGQTIDAKLLLFDGGLTAQANGSEVDTQGFEGLAVVALVGDDTTVDLTTDPLTLTFFESDDTTFGNATEVPAKNVIDNPSINAPQSQFVASLRPTKRYVWAQISAPDSGNVEIATGAILGYPVKEPVE